MNEDNAATPQRRRTDKGTLCWLAMRASELWDWIDKRNIDKHVVAAAILFGTIKVTEWAMQFAKDLHDRPGIEVAAVIAAVLAPYMALQAAAIAFYFRSRQ